MNLAPLRSRSFRRWRRAAARWTDRGRLPWLRSPWLPAAALALVVAADSVLQGRRLPLLVVGMLDEPAHAATALVLLAAFLPARAAPLAGWALAGSVLIDVDHVPLHLWGVLGVADGGRPVTHSLLTAAALAAAAVPHSRLRTPLLGLAVGVLLHFTRDIATGPGLPLLWPADARSFLLPYDAYLAPLAAVAAGATIRHAVRRPARG